MRNNITEEQITNLLQAIPRAEQVDRLRAEIEKLRKTLKDIAEDCEDDYPPSHGAIKYAVQDALRGKP